MTPKAAGRRRAARPATLNVDGAYKIRVGPGGDDASRGKSIHRRSVEKKRRQQAEEGTTATASDDVPYVTLRPHINARYTSKRLL